MAANLLFQYISFAANAVGQCWQMLSDMVPPVIPVFLLL